jgi:2-iminobutanoate/2-iminopropanoate deaminase
MQIDRLTPPNVWDSKPYRFSQAIRVRQCQELLFIAGQAGMDEQGRIVEGLEAQIRLSFDNIRRVVADAGGSMANIVRLTAYFRDMRALEPYTKILGEVFSDNFPAATVVEVKALALEPLLVEIDAIAAL